MVKTVIFGKVNKIKYEVGKGAYDKPTVRDIVELDHNEEILRFEGKPYYNDELGYSIFKATALNISEDETVIEQKKVFRADLNEIHVFTNKVLAEIQDDDEKARVEAEVEQAVAAYNKEKIDSNEDLKRYCDLHKLKYEDTDAIELANLIYGNNWNMVDGVIKKREKEVYITSSLESCYPCIDIRDVRDNIVAKYSLNPSFIQQEK